jgi:hypothetical protein
MISFTPHNQNPTVSNERALAGQTPTFRLRCKMLPSLQICWLKLFLAVSTPSMFSLELPPELVYEVLRHVIPSSSHVKQDLKKLEWPCIRNLSLSSRLLRRVALECWFHSLFIRHSSDWQRMEDFSSVKLIKTVS